MKKNYLLILIGLTVIFLIGCQTDSDATMKKEMPKDSMMEKEDSAMMAEEGFEMINGEMMEDESMMKKNGQMAENPYSGKVLAGETSKYIEFTKADYDKALGENKKILLYFYASWCPVCKKEQPETIAAFNELSDPNLVGFRVNYKDGDDDEDEKALAKQFGVAYQHTKVILKNGKQAAKYPDSWNKQRYIDELAK